MSFICRTRLVVWLWGLSWTWKLSPRAVMDPRFFSLSIWSKICLLPNLSCLRVNSILETGALLLGLRTRLAPEVIILPQSVSCY